MEENEQLDEVGNGLRELTGNRLCKIESLGGLNKGGTSGFWFRGFTL